MKCEKANKLKKENCLFFHSDLKDILRGVEPSDPSNLSVLPAPARDPAAPVKHMLFHYLDNSPTFQTAARQRLWFGLFDL